MEEVPLGMLSDDVTLPISRRDRNRIIRALPEQDKASRLKDAQQLIEANGQTRPRG